MPVRLLLPVLALLIAACSHREFRTPALNRAQALARTDVLELRVVQVWNTVEDALDHDREPGIDYYIEVDVLTGRDAGKPMTLPYDSWNVGSGPPAVDSRVVVAPADWVKRAKDSKGRPFGGW
jgi:hypothetical protein